MMNCLSERKKYQRSEKKAISDDKKDDKYYERRKRNNEAAKKSRDARKLREDYTAMRAKLLENENGILWKKIILLCQEIETLHEVIRKIQRYVPTDKADDDCSMNLNQWEAIFNGRKSLYCKTIPEYPSSSSSSSTSSIVNNNSGSVTALTVISRLSSILHSPPQSAI
ncbi:GSCOCG00005454001-RA-CDS [Cotesia congregata]|uniref:Similar to Dbp: D site-binding protein (Mus musculus) n=1 Tax=Cotesia congregata TaxID=51543 RepID=A0A8J2MAA3_COTCN|nr:GSCOCG00005454001-RA-CDS [Cotesia congregata]CAG5078279.1 Similar to Dbp: D site-binding protein (Mus musculus) [Cotesia congregata]